ncbi:MAG: hypothetical protein JNK15_08910 [Planctomycetes bacterium]|nr:hypothetical protein [Planctomycetota bacterium]
MGSAAQLLFPLITLWGLSAAAQAQTIWNVASPNGIQATIQAASPGDVILLVGNTIYEPFILDRGLTIRGNGATIGSGPASSGGSVTVTVPSGQLAHLDQINFTYGYSPFGTVGCPVDLAGAVRIDRCAFLTTNGSTPLTLSNADVVIVSSTITCSGTTSSGTALLGFGSRVTLRDCVVTGSNAGCHPIAGCSWTFPARNAAEFTNCSLHAERSSFMGGSHSTSGFPGNGANGLITTNCEVWLADGSVVGGNSVAGSGGTAFVHASTVTAESWNNQMVAGAPGGGTSSGPVATTTPLLRLQLQPVWTRGLTSSLDLHGAPNVVFAVFLTPARTSVPTPVAFEPIHAVGATALFAGLLDPFGAGTQSVAVPNQAALLHAAVWCQAVAGSSLPLRASTIAGGLVR